MLEHKSSLKNVWYNMAGYLIILAPAINKEDVSIYVNLMHFSLKFSSRFQLIRHAKQKLFIISTYLTCHYKKEETQLIYTMLRSIYILTILLQTPFLIQLIYPQFTQATPNYSQQYCQIIFFLLIEYIINFQLQCPNCIHIYAYRRM